MLMKWKLAILILILSIWPLVLASGVTTYEAPVEPVVAQKKPLPELKTYEPQVTDIDIELLHSQVNAYRAENGLNKLVVDPRLNVSATEKCNDMVVRNYWSHDAPDGTEPWTFIKKQFRSYYAAGENLAYGHKNADTTLISWQQSPSHNANMLDRKWTHTGYNVCKSNAYVNGGKAIIVVQHFIAV